MHRRDFMLKAASLAATGLVVTGCTTTATTTKTTNAGDQAAKRRSDIETASTATIDRLYGTVKGSREIVAKSSGMLVFPSVIAAGLGVGGQYGEGVLRTKADVLGYYSIASISVGLQIGAQSKAIIFLFMTQDALNKFRSSKGWSAGVDASVAVIKVGANGEIDTTSAVGPVVAFVLTNTGLMANLTLEGTKVTRLDL